MPHKPLVYSVRADLGTIQGAKQIIDDLQQWAHGNFHLDILVNNAGVERVKSLAEIQVEDYDAVYNLNVRGIILLTQAVVPHLRSGGRIINLGSVGSRAAFKDLSLYCSSKAALEGLTRCWAAELGGNGTTVNCVNPGPVQSEMLDNIPKDIVDMQKAQTPIQNRLGTIQEVADIVAGLAGRDGAWITGQVISVSGVSIVIVDITLHHKGMRLMGAILTGLGYVLNGHFKYSPKVYALANAITASFACAERFEMPQRTSVLPWFLPIISP